MRLDHPSASGIGHASINRRSTLQAISLCAAIALAGFAVTAIIFADKRASAQERASPEPVVKQVANGILFLFRFRRLEFGFSRY